MNDSAPGWFHLSHADVIGGTPGDATAIVYDSRRAMPGCVFVAIRGANFDGHQFIGQAVQRGAAYVIAQHGAEFDRPDVRALVLAQDTRIALAEAAAGFYGWPAQDLGMVGVTGTDGKTTTSHLIAHVLTATGHSAGYLSSVEFGLPESAELNVSHMTTLEAPEIQRHLAAIRDADARYGVVEASSHGLILHRVDECDFDVGVFTNLTQDHLDFHETMEAYRDAKAELFRMVADANLLNDFPKGAVLNVDDPAGEYMRSASGLSGDRVLRYGLGEGADLSAVGITAAGGGTRFVAEYRGNRRASGPAISRVEAQTPLLGEFNVTNCLAAVGVALTQNIPLEDAVGALASFPGVPGRMEIIAEGQPFGVIVDIASTEQAMRNVLGVLRPVTAGEVIVVFGAAGERDRERRHGIARAVAEIADRAIITNEDPRSEDPGAIINEIAGALETAGWDSNRFERIEDRRSALARAFEIAGEGDCVLLAGKGTEQSIVIGTTHHPWDERLVARELLRGRFGV